MEYQKFSPGDPLRNIRATDWNRMQDATRAFFEQGFMRPRSQSMPGAESQVVYVRNDSGADLTRGNVLDISAPIFTPTDNPDGFGFPITFIGDIPAADEGTRFAVLVESIPDGAVGRAVMSGLAVVLVNVADEAHEFAATQASETELISGDAGVEILWKESGTGESKWAIIRIGGTGGGGLREFFVLRDNATLISPNRWAYDGTEQVLDIDGTFKEAPNAWTGNFYNSVESNNSATGVQGSGDNVADFPGGVELQPLGPGVFWAREVRNCEGDIEVIVTHPNNPGGNCEVGS